jgi:hypothetical protein
VHLNSTRAALTAFNSFIIKAGESRKEIQSNCISFTIPVADVNNSKMAPEPVAAVSPVFIGESKSKSVTNLTTTAGPIHPITAFDFS